MGKIGLIELLDRLEEIIEDSRRMPLTNKVMIDAYDVLELIDKIRLSLPDEVKKAEEVVKERDRIIADATREAENMKGSATEYLKSKVSEEEIVKAAKEESERILNEARQEAESIRKGANEYAAHVLTKLDDNLARALQVIRRGVEELEKGSI